MTTERFTAPIEERVAIAKENIVKDGKYPRAVRAADLIKFDLITSEDQRALCHKLINDPDNKYGRVLVISRNPDEKSSPVRWFARGRENGLGESFIPPHIEPDESLIETFELVEGRAIFVYHESDDINSPCRFVDLKPHEPVHVLPGQIHSILCVSEIVEVVEFKLVSPKKICPTFAHEVGLVDENCGEKSGEHITKYMARMHTLANQTLASQ